VVTCEGGKPYLGLISLLPLQNHRSPGTSPLGLTSLKRKNLPIVVTLGGIGSCYASLAFYLIAFSPSYKLCDNIVKPSLDDTFLVSLASRIFILQAYLATPLGCFPFSLIIFGKLSGDSIDLF
jgi:hypothetical protein